MSIENVMIINLIVGLIKLSLYKLVIFQNHIPVVKTKN